MPAIRSVLVDPEDMQNLITVWSGSRQLENRSAPKSGTAELAGLSTFDHTAEQRCPVKISCGVNHKLILRQIAIRRVPIHPGKSMKHRLLIRSVALWG